MISLRQAHANQSNNPSIRFHIAYKLQQLVRNDKSQRELDKLLEIYFQFPERVETKNYMPLYNCLSQLKRLVKVLNTLLEALY